MSCFAYFSGAEGIIVPRNLATNHTEHSLVPVVEMVRPFRWMTPGFWCERKCGCWQIQNWWWRTAWSNRTASLLTGSRGTCTGLTPVEITSLYRVWTGPPVRSWSAQKWSNRGEWWKWWDAGRLLLVPSGFNIVRQTSTASWTPLWNHILMSTWSFRRRISRFS